MHARHVVLLLQVKMCGECCEKSDVEAQEQNEMSQT